MGTLENNKAIVQRFNREVIASWNEASFRALMADDFINLSAPAGMDNGPNGMRYFFNEVLRPALTDLKVTIHHQLAEGDWVTSRKTISGTHSGELLGISATGKKVEIEVIDMVRLKDGKYLGHWGITTLSDLLASLKGAHHE